MLIFSSTTCGASTRNLGFSPGMEAKQATQIKYGEGLFAS
jgi:hypothetical protein